MPEQPYMTQDECDRKHRITKWMMMTMIGFLSVILAMNAWALYASQAASMQSAVQERDIVHLTASIAELRGEIRSLRTSIERMNTGSGG